MKKGFKERACIVKARVCEGMEDHEEDGGDKQLNESGVGVSYVVMVEQFEKFWEVLFC